MQIQNLLVQDHLCSDCTLYSESSVLGMLAGTGGKWYPQDDPCRSRFRRFYPERPFQGGHFGYDGALWFNRQVFLLTSDW